jgi:hypothetical protein
MIIEAKPHQVLPTNWHEREKLRDKGQFWTPSWVAKAMVAYVSEGVDLVFDPATGRGAFFQALLQLEKRQAIFYGTDVDEEVLKDKIYASPSCKVELRDFIKNPPPRKFKGIVANPPYIRHHRIDETTKLFLKKLSAKISHLAIDGRAGYHIYFFLQALNHLEENGRLAFIMPADTCEGVFARNLWKWIAANFCIECVVTFDEKATPFPNVDTNAVIFFIRKAEPKETLRWVRVQQPDSSDLFEFVASGFKKKGIESFEVFDRELKEALATGLSRPVQNNTGFRYHLSDFATVMRGIATGANEFFFLTRKQAEELKLPNEFLKVAIGRTRDVLGDIITHVEVSKLEDADRPTLLFSIDANDKLPKPVEEYLTFGEKQGLPTRPLILTRKPWYKMEKREIPPLLFAYLGRRNARFVKNEAGVLPLTGFLCVYPLYSDEKYVNSLWKVLNHPDTLRNLNLVGKSYGSGAIKVEPRNLARLPIPEPLVEEYNLKRQYKAPTGQFDLFKEPQAKYLAKKRKK